MHIQDTFYKHLEIITPNEIGLKIANVTSQKLTQGSEIRAEGKITMVLSEKSKWHSIITSFSVSPQQRQYVDEMLTGSFEKWKHLHKFYDVNNNNNRKQTQVVDKIDFELRYGRIGRLFDGYAYKSLQKLFCHRKIATRVLENNR